MNMLETDALVIGGGPAGLAAAEALIHSGAAPLIVEAKPSLGRKFLMAGKSGLNLTKDEGPEAFLAAFRTSEGAPPEPLLRALRAFGPAETSDWARGLGRTLFTGSSGRVFPVEMKASPLLRAWLARLAAGGAELRTRWRWTGWRDDAFLFETPEGPASVRAGAAVLALGGASWPRLGSDAAWVPALAEAGGEIAPFRPANMGFDVAWSRHMAERFAGAPVKPVRLGIGSAEAKGECVVTAAGIEGGAVYALSSAIRDALGADGADVSLDLAPDRDRADLAAALSRPRGRASLAEHLRKRARISGVKAALLRELAPETLGDAEAMAAAIKAAPLRVLRPRPMEEAISSAGGLRWSSLTPDFELKSRPGVFAAGEMLDWEAPTGGYLLTACLATGRAAGRAAGRRGTGGREN